jgi:hypothetical protein
MKNIPESIQKINNKKQKIPYKCIDTNSLFSIKIQTKLTSKVPRQSLLPLSFTPSPTPRHATDI